MTFVERNTRLIPAEEWQLASGIVSIGLITATLLASFLHDYILQDAVRAVEVEIWIPTAVGVYLGGLVISRYLYHGVYTIYETLWGCNVALLLAIVGMVCKKQLLVSIAACIVSGDQMSWYIDVVGYLVWGKCPIGVIKYLTYEENKSIPKRLFATHHLWFLPLCVWYMNLNGGMHPSSFFAAALITSFLASYCRAFTPFQARVYGSKDPIYMNINGAFEFWRDIKVPFVHCLDRRHPLLYLPFLAIVGNVVANGLPCSILFTLAKSA